MFIKSLNEISKGDVKIAGGKGASLGEMSRAGISVPAGFVIVSDAFKEFLKVNNLLAEIDAAFDEIDESKIHTIETASEKIRALIGRAEIPKPIQEEVLRAFKKLNSRFVAVRSSATAEDSSSAAWAGQLDTFLNTTGKNILENVQKCWASLFTPRAIFYRFEKGLHKQKISVAVVVQKMVQSEVSGIAFSVHPVTQDRNQLIIEAGFGLGEAIVSGQITPDSYVVEKDKMRIIERYVSEQSKGIYRASKGGDDWRDIPAMKGATQKLSDKEIIELSNLIMRIENHYCFPCDIEWAQERGIFYITQSRPITTLSDTAVVKRNKKLHLSSTTKEIKNPADLDFNGYHILPEASRASWYYVTNIIGNYLSVPHREWGVFTGGIVVHQDGKFQLYLTVKDNTPFKQTLVRFANDPSLLLKLERFITKTKEKGIGGIMSHTLAKIPKKKLAELMQNHYDRLIDLHRAALALRYLDRGCILRLKEIFKKEPDPDACISTVTVSEKLTFTLQEEIGLLKLAQEIVEKRKSISDAAIQKQIQTLLSRYRWSSLGYYHEEAKTKEDYEQKLAESTAHDPHALLGKIEERIKKNFDAKLAMIKRIKSEEDKKIIEIAVESTILKDYFKSSINELQFYGEALFEEIAQRTGETVETLKNLMHREVINLLDGKRFDAELMKRRLQHSIIVGRYGKSMTVLTGSDADEFEKRYLQLDQSRKEFKGRTACKGIVNGKVKVVINIKDFQKVEKGDVLVVMNTSPDFMPILGKASAIVAEEGGLTAHVSIISRELGIPCVVGISHITKILKDGDLVEVDADNGVVKILNDGARKTPSPQASGNWYKLLVREGVDTATISGLDVVFFDLVRRFGDGNSQRFFTHIHNRNFTHYIGVDQQKLCRAVYQEYFRDSAQIKTYYRKGLRLLRDVKKQSSVWNRRLGSKPDAETLLGPFLVFRKQFEEVNRIYSIISWLGIEAWQADFEEKLNAMIARNKLEKRQDEIALSVYRPWKKTALIEIQEKLADGKSPQQLAEEYQFLRSWSVVWHKPITAEWVASLGKTAKNEMLKTLGQKQVLKLLRPDKEEKKFLSLAPYIVFFKDWRDDVRRSHAYYWSFLFEKIGKKFMVETDDVGYLTLDEIESSLREDKLDEESIRHRKTSASAVIERDGKVVVINSPLPKEIDEIISTVDATRKDLSVRGKIAQKGLARGVVRIIRSYHDIKHVQEGDILVANTTHPNYLPAMQKAAAFITNEGGAISHAAIVAREMKKPCIVGTGNATKILKDGDLVEVDANKGIVRKIG